MKLLENKSLDLNKAGTNFSKKKLKELMTRDQSKRQ
jgi:hypothetical protein